VQTKSRANHSFSSSSIGMKYIMGVTGLIWAGFVLVHMLGNLLLFAGSDNYNIYSHAITSTNLIYIAEAILIISLVVHVITAFRLTLMNQKARTQRYAMSAIGHQKTSVVAKTMIYHGTIILFFIMHHLFSFKFGPQYQVNINGTSVRDIYKLVVEVFQRPYYIVEYLFCLLMLGVHLRWGVSSALQSLGGITDFLTEPQKKVLGYLYAFLVMAGFMAQPIYIFFIS
jgi:succinate dehydrogenase / fumarate reductase cytochrome b subunit